MTANDTAKTVAVALGRSPYIKGAEKLAADLGAKPTATLVNTRMEVPSPRNGRPAYRWVDGCYVVRPDGTKEFPPVRIREAWSRCASEGWAFKVVSESEYKEQTVTTKHTPGPWKWDESWGAIMTDHNNPSRLISPVWTGCNPRGMGPEAEAEDAANARLIAASPDLLEALKALLQEVATIDHAYALRMTENNPACKQARAALAKATGQNG